MHLPDLIVHLLLLGFEHYPEQKKPDRSMYSCMVMCRLLV
jgi:hypothetical protein